jgi:hypothetical protein
MGKIKEFNDYKIENDYAIIYLKNRKGEIYNCFVDIFDLEKLILFNKHWHLSWNNHSKSYYAKYTIYAKNKKYKTIYLHRFLLNPPNNLYIDHKDHNTLDNRRNNLIIVDNSTSLKNRKSSNINNKTGYRNVCEFNGEFIVQLQIDGKNKKLGSFDDIEEAAQFAKKMRQKYYVSSIN